MQYDGSININSKIDERGFNVGIKSMTASVMKLAAAVGIAFGIGAAGQRSEKAVGDRRAKWPQL